MKIDMKPKIGTKTKTTLHKRPVQRVNHMQLNYHIRVDSSTYDTENITYVLGEGRQLFWLEVCGGPDFEHYFCFLPFLGHMLLCLQTDLETFLKPTLLKC